jgi:hypothetical protein
MVCQLLIVLYLTVLQCGPPVYAFLHSPIFRSWPTRIQSPKLPLQLQCDPNTAKGSSNSCIEQLKEARTKGDSDGFRIILNRLYQDNKPGGLTKNGKNELRCILKDWENRDRRGVANILRSLDGIFSARNKEDKFVLDSLIVKYLRSPSNSLRSFPLFLTSLKKLDYHWNLFDREMQERTLNMFDDMANDEMLKGRKYGDLIGESLALE